VKEPAAVPHQQQNRGDKNAKHNCIPPRIQLAPAGS